MNNTKALKILNKNLQVAVHDCDGLNPECEQEQQEQVKALQIAVKAVEKQIPKKPRKTRSEIVCPTCNTLVGSSPYCRYCGQALDWSDTE